MYAPCFVSVASNRAIARCIESRIASARAAVWFFVHGGRGLAGLLFEPLPRALTHFSDSLLRAAFLIMVGMAVGGGGGVPLPLLQ